MAPSDGSRKKSQILLVKVNKQMFIHPVRHLNIMFTNRAPVSHASHDSQTECLDGVVDVADQEASMLYMHSMGMTKISKLCLRGTISVALQTV